MTALDTTVEDATAALAEARAAEKDAARQLAEAVEHRQKIRAKVANGDDKVTGADLTDADQAVELGNLRAEAATKRVAQAEAALHQAEIDRLRADVRAVLEGDGVERLAGELETVAEAVVSLIGEWRTQRGTVDELVRRSVNLSPLPADLKREGNTLKWNSRPVSVPPPDALIAALLGHIFDGQGVSVGHDLGRGIGHYTGGYASSVAHKYPLGAVLNRYATDRVFELAGKERWTE